MLIRKVLTLSNFSHTDIDCQIQHYNTKLKNVLNEIAPVTTKTITVRPHSAIWYNKDIKASKQLCRKYERKWRKSGLTVHEQIYKDQCYKFNKLSTVAKSAYTQPIIEDNASDRKQLFQTLNQLLGPFSTVLPSCFNSTKDISDNFARHFVNKIEEQLMSFKRSNIKFMVNYEERSMVGNENFDAKLFLSFSCVSLTQVSDLLILSRNTTCSLDPIFTLLLKKCKCTILVPITAIIDKSFTSSNFPPSFKIAVSRLLFKNPAGNSEDINNYRTVSNLCFVLKILEKAAESQIREHIISHNLSDSFQSAYRAHHSTETALIKVLDDILKSRDSKKTVALLILDISAAFHTVDHNILLSRMSSVFGMRNSALD